ncbi:MAG: MBL fold metallo-hydrolase [Deltaproteobacteria bacterium]|nr:MBL fold metallo-hydrolase [Deltaproteobacteria bacterium]
MFSRGKLSKLKLTVIAEDTVAYESPYLGQHGVSFLLTTEKDGIKKNVLVDVAQNPTALLENINMMQISLSCIDAVVLTHCHYDHTQGLGTIIKEIGKKDIPIIAHPDIFRLNFITDPYLERVTDFEEVGMNLFTIDNGEVKTDPMLDDISVVANIKGRGLVIVTGCSHAGIVNITRQAIKLTDTEKIHGIIGGFHLIEASESRIKKTAQALKEFNPDWIYAGHCTGFKAQVELYNTFKDRFSPLHTGMIIEVP